MNASRTNVRHRGGHPRGSSLRRRRHSNIGSASAGMSGHFVARDLISSRWWRAISMIFTSMGGLRKLVVAPAERQTATVKTNLSMDLAANPPRRTFTQPISGRSMNGANMASELQKNAFCIQCAPGLHYGGLAMRALERKVDRHMRSPCLHMHRPSEPSLPLWYLRERGDDLPPGRGSS